jgi:hypothetical protein
MARILDLRPKDIDDAQLMERAANRRVPAPVLFPLAPTAWFLAIAAYP